MQACLSVGSQIHWAAGFSEDTVAREAAGLLRAWHVSKLHV